MNFSERWRGYVGLRGDLLRYDVQGREPLYGPVNSGRGHDSVSYTHLTLPTKA